MSDTNDTKGNSKTVSDVVMNMRDRHTLSDRPFIGSIEGGTQVIQDSPRLTEAAERAKTYRAAGYKSEMSPANRRLRDERVRNFDENGGFPFRDNGQEPLKFEYFDGLAIRGLLEIPDWGTRMAAVRIAAKKLWLAIKGV